MLFNCPLLSSPVSKSHLLKFPLKCLHRKYWQLQINPLCTFLLTPISFQHCLTLSHILKHTHSHTLAYIYTVGSLLRLVTRTLLSGAIKVLSANSLFQKLSHVVRGVSLPVVTLWAPGTGTSHYFHGKGQTLCHLTLKWSWVELPWDNDQRSVFCFASLTVRVDLRGTGRSPICPWAPLGRSGFQTPRFR